MRCSVDLQEGWPKKPRDSTRTPAWRQEVTAAVSQGPVEREGDGGGWGTDQLRLVSDVAQEIGNAVGKCKVINTVIDRFILGSSIPLQLEQIIPTSSLPTDNRNSAVASGDELEKHLGN